MSSMITKAAACWSRGLGIKNLSFVMYLAQPSSLDMLVLVGKPQLCGLACSPMRTCCTSTYGVLGLPSWPACSASGEWPPQDLSIGVRLVGAGSELLA